jgi:hypothetical protein
VGLVHTGLGEKLPGGPVSGHRLPGAILVEEVVSLVEKASDLFVLVVDTI